MIADSDSQLLAVVSFRTWPFSVLEEVTRRSSFDEYCLRNHSFGSGFLLIMAKRWLIPQ
jgi:hypothetical protein